MITRTIILNELPQYNNRTNKPVRGIISLNGESNLSGILRLFNVCPHELPLTMALKIGEKKFIYPDILDPTNYTFKIVNAPITNQISVLIASTKNQVTPIAFGKNAENHSNFEELFEELTPAELDDLIEKELSKDPDFSQTPQTFSADEPNEEEVINEENFQEAPNFYTLIQPQLDELFEKFPHFKEFENLIQNTKWIKVHYSKDDDNHYILGKLFDEENLSHLCYGIPAQSHNINPPTSLKEYCQWIPLSPQDPEGKGYWVMYQNAETGENVKL